MALHLKPGDVVVYRKQKRSNSPGPRAKDIHPDEHGNEYSYLVDKFWVVTSRNDDGTLTLGTRRGKKHTGNESDERLRKPTLWERLFLRNKFPQHDANVV